MKNSRENLKNVFQNAKKFSKHVDEIVGKYFFVKFHKKVQKFIMMKIFEIFFVKKF